MTVRIIHCLKLNKDAEGLDYQPYPGELGERIYQNISKEAWQAWLGRQTMYINEYRLDLSNSKARSFLADEMEKFLFGQGDDSAPLAQFVPE